MRQVYTHILPLGLRTLQKVEQIVREEMDNAGAQELLMSALLPAEAYQASGRMGSVRTEYVQNERQKRP